MNSLVQRLSQKKSAVKISLSKNAALEERIDMQFVHILFSKTGTELGISLDMAACDVSAADFNARKGSIHLEGTATLDFQRVRCIADVKLPEMDGMGCLMS